MTGSQRLILWKLLGHVCMVCMSLRCVWDVYVEYACFVFVITYMWCECICVGVCASMCSVCAEYVCEYACEYVCCVRICMVHVFVCV